jgi:hypothetical protein
VDIKPTRHELTKYYYSGHFIVDPGAASITIRHNTIYDYNTTGHLNGTPAVISNRIRRTAPATTS